jgi:hypothetical protein
VARLPDNDHLDELLDAALAGTFPASDPTSSFVCEQEPPPPGRPVEDDRPARDKGEPKPG